MDIIKNSFFFGLIRWFIKAYHHSFLYHVFTAFDKRYQVSFCRHVLTWWLSRPSCAHQSLFAGMLNRLHHMVHKIGLPIYSLFSISMSRRLFQRILDFCRSFIADSFFLRPLLLLDANRLILLCLALYFPIDYFLRQILQITALSSVWDELLMVFAVGVILSSYSKPGHFVSSPKVTPVDAFLIFFVAVSTFLMLLTTDYPAIALAGYRAVVQYMAWFFIVVRLLRNDGDIKIFFYGLCTAAMLIGLHGIYQYIVAAPIPAQWVTQSEVGVRTRVYSIIGSPNVMGSFLIMTAPMTLAAAYAFKDLRLKLICLCGTGCICLSLLFTFSRGAWGGFVLTALFFSILVDKRLIALMMTGGTALLFLSSSIANRITFLFTSDFAEASAKGGRALRWEFGYQIIAEHPLFGLGLGRFGGAVAMQNQILDETDTFEYFYMDNYYLKTAVEMGLIGLSAFILLLAVLIVWSIRSLYREKDGSMQLLLKGTFSGMIGVLLHSYFENIFEVPAMNTYFWVLAAILLYAGFIKPKQNNAPPDIYSPGHV